MQQADVRNSTAYSGYEAVVYTVCRRIAHAAAGKGINIILAAI
jgi:hypothetical protein